MEEQFKLIKEFLKEVHGMSATQVDKYFATAETVKEAISNIKAKESESYDEGVTDGQTKLKKVVIESVKKELGIELSEKELKKVEDFGKLIKPKIEEKFKPSEDEAESVKEWKKKYEDVLAEKDSEVLSAKQSAKKEVDELRRDSLARDILKAEGYTIPENTDQFSMKLEMVKALIEKKGFNYEIDQKDGLYYRMKEDGTKERVGNKAVTYNDDFKQYADVTFGKTPAEQKGGGMGKESGTGGSGQETKEFDFSKIEDKSFAVPKTVAEARNFISNPMASLADRTIVREFIDILESQEKTTTN